MTRLAAVLAVIGAASLVYPVTLVYVMILEAPHESLVNGLLETGFFDQFLGVVLVVVLFVHLVVRGGLRVSPVLIIYLGLCFSLFIGLGMDLYYRNVKSGGLMILLNWFGLFFVALYISNFLTGLHYDIAKHFMVLMFVVSTSLVLLTYYGYLGTGEYRLFDLKIVSGVRYEYLRLQGFLDNSNGFASFYCLLVPWTFFQGLSAKKRFAALYLVLAAGLFGWAMFLTVSRSAILATVTSTAVGGFIALVRWGNRRWMDTVTLAGMALLVLLVSAFGVFYVSVVEGYYLEEPQIIGWSEKTRLYTAALELILKNPLGVGMGEFRDAIYYYGNPRSPNPHNSYLAVGGMSGVIGIVLILWFVGAQLTSAARNALRDPERLDFEYVAYFTGFLAFWIHNMFHTVLRTSLFWVLLGFFLAYLYRQRAGSYWTLGFGSDEP